MKTTNKPWPQTISTQPTRLLRDCVDYDTAASAIGANAYDKLVDSSRVFALATTNAKLEKSIAQFGDDILTAGFSLAPHRRSGVNLCESAGFCSAVCNLWFSGRTVFENVREAMLRRARLLIEKPHLFREFASHDCEILARRAADEKKTGYVRPNIASDLDFVWLAEQFPQLRFYDYTKVVSRVERMLSGDWPTNYQLTYSYSERSSWQFVERVLAAGHNVSMVFDSEYRPQQGYVEPLPKAFRGYPIVDGDKHDLRHTDYDGHGVIVGLRFKGSRLSKMFAESIARGFTIPAAPIIDAELAAAAAIIRTIPHGLASAYWHHNRSAK